MQRRCVLSDRISAAQLADRDKKIKEVVDEVLSEWHYDHDGMSKGAAHRHGSFSDSLAFTHCICYGAGFRVAERLWGEAEAARHGRVDSDRWADMFRAQRDIAEAQAEAATRALRDLLAIGTSDEPGLVRDRAVALLGDDDESTA